MSDTVMQVEANIWDFEKHRLHCTVVTIQVRVIVSRVREATLFANYLRVIANEDHASC